MQGRTHCLSGIALGAAVAPLVGADHPAEVALYALATGGFAIFPDLDHPKSLASTSLGPVTGLVSRAMRGLSAAVYKTTASEHDKPDTTGTHRHLTHTVTFAVLLGVLAGLGALATPWVVAGVLAIGVSFTHLAVGRGTGKLAAFLPRGLRSAVRGWPLLLGLGAATWWLLEHQANPAVLHAELAALSWHVGLVVALGMIAHDLGDALTHSGCPFLFPLRFHGERWYELRPPQGLTFRTGALVESWLVTPALLGVIALVVWQQDIGGALIDLWHQGAGQLSALNSE